MANGTFLGCGRRHKFALSVAQQQEVLTVPEERLEMLKWHHLKAELDDREKEWPKGSKYELDYEKQTVTWFFGEQSDAPDRLVWHLTQEEIASPKPLGVANRIIREVNRLADGID